jgi:hypothetical protein
MWKQARAWACAAIVFALFTLGPLLQINGQFLFSFDNLLREQGLAQDVTFPMPFALLHYMPIIQANRVPNRFSVVLSLSLAVLVGYGTFWILSKLASSRSTSGQTVSKPLSASLLVSLVPTALLLIVVLFDQVSIPIPLTDARVPEPYAMIAAEDGDFAVLQLPLGWRNSFGTWGAERTQLEYYQSLHHKYMLAGNISRAPSFKFDYFARIPLFRALTDTELYREVDTETLVRAQAQAGELVNLYDVRYLIVHEPIPLRYPYVDTMPATRDLAFALFPLDPEPVASGGGATAYRIIQPSLPDTVRVDFGDWTSAPYRGAGWADDEEVFAATANWASGTEASVFLPVRGGGDRLLSVQIAPFTYPDAPPQTLSLSLNGQSLDSAWVLDNGWQVIEVPLPEFLLRQGPNTLTLYFDNAIAPSSVLPGNTDDRSLSAAVDWVEISNR